MIWIRGHPGFRTLSRYTDGALTGRRHARVADHLARCARCREEVALLRRISDAVRELPTPAASANTFRRAMDRRRNGERVLLPQRDPGAVTPRAVFRRAPAAIAAGLAVLLVGIVLSTRILEADHPTLRILPEQPAPGEVLRVEYRPGALFEGDTHLKLRARFRTADNRSWHLLAGILARGDDGVFRTEVALPDSVVYAAFAVEDLWGQRLDSNNQKLWDVLVHGPDRVPTLDAMTARVRDLELRDWGAAYDLAREMTRLFPESPQSWAIRFSFESSLFDDDSIAGEHRAHFERLERRLSGDAGATADEAGWLAIYALTLGDVSSGTVWVQRAAAGRDATAAVYEAKAVLTALELRDQPELLLETLDALWQESPRPIAGVTPLALAHARRSRNARALEQWIPRHLVSRPSQVRVLEDIGPVSRSGDLGTLLRDLAQEATHRLRQGAEGTRPLFLTAEAYEAVRARHTQELLIQLAQTVEVAGNPTEAAALAREAIPLSWSSGAQLEAGRILLNVGDTVRALEAYARAAADPSSAAEARRRVLGVASASELEAWEREVESREAELHHQVMAGSVVRYVNLPPHLEPPRTPRIRVVAFMDPYSVPALEQLNAVNVVAERLAADGDELLLIDTRGGSHLQRLLEARGMALPVIPDPDGVFRATFRSARTPDYFVMDTFGRVRFQHSELPEILRQVQALKRAAGTAVSAE